MRELALFAGAGGGILGGRLLGWRTVCAVEVDAYARQVLLARQRDGCLDPFPIWDDVCTFDGKPWQGHVDVVSGGFPCQDISSAGTGTGLEGGRSGLWREMARVIGEVRPPYVFVENSPMLTSRGLGDVLGDLATMGYDARWGVLGACHVGAPHKRERFWLAARMGNTDSTGLEGQPGDDVPKAVWKDETRPATASGVLHRTATQRGSGVEWYASEPAVGRVADGVAARVDRLRALGNGQVPAVAALAWETLTRGWL